VKKLLALCLIGVGLVPAYGLTWPEALSLATQKNNQILSARKQADAYQWSYYKSFSNFLPQVSANGSTGNSVNSSGSSNNYSYGLSASQAIFKGMGNYFNMRSAAVNYDNARASLQNTEADVFYQVRQAFIDLLIAQQNFKVREKIRDSRADNARMIKLFYGSGKEDKGNYLRSQAQLADAEFSIASAQRQLDLARLKLAQLLNVDATSAEGTQEARVTLLPNLDKLAKEAPSYLMAKYQLELADLNLQDTWSEFLPSVSLNGSYSRSGVDWTPSNSSKSWSLSVSLPIFPGGSNFADRMIYGLQLDKAREDFKKSEKDIYYSIKDAYESLKDAIDSYSSQKKYLDASSERSKIAQIKYLNGLTSYYEWDQIQNEYINNQIGMLSADRSALVAEANWYKSYGGYVK
jgi:outer membrane protein